MGSFADERKYAYVYTLWVAQL